MAVSRISARMAFSSATATPSSAFVSVTTSAQALTESCALPIATPRPASWSIGTSRTPSPMATTSVGSIPSFSSSTVSVFDLSTDSDTTSR